MRRKKGVFFFVAALALTVAILDVRAQNTRDPADGYGDERAQHAIIGREAALFLRAGYFQEIEQWAELYRRDGLRTVGGNWKLDAFYQGAGEAGSLPYFPPVPDPDLASPGETPWEILVALTEKWIQDYPTSPTPHLVYANALYEDARELLDSARTAEVLRENYIAYVGTMRHMRDYLDANQTVASADPHWYALRTRAATALRESYGELMDRAGEGFERFPHYYPLYTAVAESMLPTWGGNPYAIDEFASTAVGLTRRVDGEAMYVRVYWAVATALYRDTLFDHLDIDWERMKSGMDDIMLRYPAQWNVNRFAYLSCIAGDDVEARRYISMIERGVISEAWHNKPIYETCRKRVMPPA